MNIANQLAAQQQEIVDVLGKMATGFDGLSSSVEQLADSMNKAADETEKQSDQEKKLADYQKKRERFQKKYNKELDRFAGVIALARKSQDQLNKLNQKYNAAIKATTKILIGENTLRQKALKNMTMFKDAVGIAAAKLKTMPGVGAIGRGMGAAGRAAGSLLGKMGKVLPMASILAIPALVVRQLMKVDSAMASIAKSTGLAGKNLQMVQKRTIDAASSLYAFGLNLEDAAKQSAALVDALGNAEYVTEKLIRTTSLIAKATGMSAQEAANLSATLIKGFGKTDEQVKSFANNMMTFASKSGVNARKVMRDISNDSNLTAIYLGRGENYLANAAVLAAKMGKSLSEQNQTLDAFKDIESSIETVERINKLTGSNLNAQKMQMFYMTQDIEGAMRELQKAFASPRAQAALKRMPGAFKDVASSLGLSVKDLMQMDRVMKDFDKSSKSASKEQLTIEKAIADSTTIMDKLKNIFFQFVLPAFNNLGDFLVNKIKPSIDSIVQSASNFGRELNSAMNQEDTFSGKLSVAFRKIIDAAKPTIMKLFDDIMNYIRPTLNELVDYLGDELEIRIDSVTGLGRNRQEIEAEKLDKRAKAAGVHRGTMIDNPNYNPDASWLDPLAKMQPKRIMHLKSDAEYRAAIEEAEANKSATGNVFSRPTMALVGEEGRSEVVIPTERIRKGLPVSGAVANELSSIGVPGFSMGAVRVSGESATTAANTFQMNQQRRALLYAQGDPEAVRRTERAIEQQAAEIRAQQRKILNEIVKINNEADFQGYFGGGPAGMPTGGGGERDPRRRQKNRFHDYATTLDNFMMLTGYTFGDFFDMLPNVIEKPIETAFNKLPESMRDGLTTGTQAAWDAYIATGSFEKALETGVQTGLLTYGTKEKATLSGQIGLLGSEYMRTGNLRTSAASTLQSSMYDNSSFFGSSYGGAQGRINRQQQLSSISEEDFYTLLADEQEEFVKAAQPRLDAAHQELLNAQKNTAEILKRQEQENEKFEAEKAAAARQFELYKNSEIYQQNDAYQAARKRDRENELLAFQKRTAEMERKNAEAQKKAQEKEDIALEAQTEAQMEYNEGAAKLNKKQADAIEEYEDNTKLSGKLLKDAAKDQAMMGGMEGVLRALQEGEGVQGAIKTGLSSAAGGAAQGAITAGLTASGVPAPIAGLVGKFGGQFVGKGVGKALGFLGLGGKNVKPKKAGIKIADIVVDGLARASAPGNQLSDFFSTGSRAHRVIQGNIMLASQKPDTFVEPIRRALQSNSGRRFSKDETLGFIQLLYGKGLEPKERHEQLDKFEGMLEGRAPSRAGASGAIVSRPTVALIGEAGPEALMPLENAPGARPLNGVGGDGGEMLQEIKRMNQMLAQMANRPIQLDGQRVNTVLNTVNSDDIRAGIYTVNSR